MPINSINNIVGQPGTTSTISALFAGDTTDVLNVDDTGLELLSSISNLPNNIISVFIQNQGAENVGVFVGASDAGFTNGVILAENNGITIEPLGNNVYLKTAANTTDIVCIVQFSLVSIPPIG